MSMLNKYNQCFRFFYRRLSNGQHRCVTPLYRIPMGNFNYVIRRFGA